MNTTRSAIVLIVLWLTIVPLAHAADTNLAINGDFEADAPAPWQFSKTDGCIATGVMDPAEHHGGRQSFKLHSESPRKANVYAAASQKITVKADSTYHVSLWCKGKSVGACWAGGGKGWMQRNRLPADTFDWTFVTFDVKTGADETSFEFRINVDSTTDALWIDDVVFSDAPTAAAANAASASGGLMPAARLYPIPETGLGPALALRAGDDANFGADVKIGYEPQGLHLIVNVLDPTPGPASGGESMWLQDCIQLGIDADPALPKEGPTSSCFELGFALLGENQVANYAWHSGAAPFDFGNVIQKGVRKPGGYQLDLLLKWESLGLSAKSRPDALGIDLVIVDGKGPHGRRFVEWTPGITHGKLPGEYAMLVHRRGDAPVARVRLDHTTCDRDENVTAYYSEFAANDLPAATLSLRGQDGANTAVALGTIALPAAPAGGSRSAAIVFPSDKLPEGTLSVLASAGDSEAAKATLIRMDLATRVPSRLAELQTQFDQLQATLSQQPAVAGDSYVSLGVQVADRFLRRVGDNLAKPRQSLQWSWLQLEEVNDVLADTAQRVSRLQAGEPPVRVEAPDAQQVKTNGGILESAGRPAFLYGYGHFGQVTKDLPNFPALGTTLIAQEIGPRSLQQDGTLDQRFATCLNTLRTAASLGERVDLMLSPHLFPKWPIEQNADLASANQGSFLKVNIYHPKYNEVVEAFLRKAVPTLKDQPGLLSFCLSNEPVYRWTGLDAYSRPMWAKYLKNRHGDIASLNTLYGTHYGDFADVPIPSDAAQSDVAGQRAYFDWIVFNQQSFSGWHAWMNAIVKELAPNIPTHAKLQARAFDRARLFDGTDPEQFCDITDWAGNDCWANPTLGARYGYGWKLEESWYELLHAFRGQPVVNSENHLIPDGMGPIHVLPGQTRSVLWQGALHHQYATTIWEWEEATVPDLAGSIYFRPANVFAAGRTMLDLHRLAPELTAVNRDAPQVALLYSTPSIYWQDDCGEATQNIFGALNMLGVPATFISEKQLAEGRRSSANEKIKVIVLPHTTHVRQSTVDALAKFISEGGNLVFAGDNCLARDEYDRPTALPAAVKASTQLPFCERDELWMPVLLPELKANNILAGRLTLADGQAATGVEYRMVADGDSVLIPLTNLLSTPLAAKLQSSGNAIDLISNEKVDLSNLRLDPMQPRLLKIDRATLAP